MRLRISLGAVGILGIAYGAWRVLGNASASKPPKLAEWLIGTVFLHDFILVPITLGVGYLLTRTVRPRARRYLQGGLVTAALVTAVAIPLIYRRGKGLPGKTLEVRNYGANLLIILAVIAAVTAAAYAAHVLRAQRGSEANVRPSADQTSGTP